MDIKEINENIQIESFLESQGYSPAKVIKGGRELWYCSPLHNEKTPSFKVETLKNVWYDYSMGKGGKLIELLIQLKNISVKDAVYFFNREYNGAVINEAQREQKIQLLKKEETESSQILQEIIPIKNVKLWDYLRERKIDFDIANKFLTEVHYMSNGRNWFGVGFKCDCGGYEIRSAIFKRNINGKSISTISHNSKDVKVFEGFFDFLSYASEHRENFQNFDYIVLNTSAFAERMYNNTIKKAEDDLLIKLLKYDRIDTYFDNDSTGKKITKMFQEIFSVDNDITLNDCSIFYEKYEDYNQFCTIGRVNGDFTPQENFEKQNKNSYKL